MSIQWMKQDKQKTIVEILNPGAVVKEKLRDAAERMKKEFPWRSNAAKHVFTYSIKKTFEKLGSFPLDAITVKNLFLGNDKSVRYAICLLIKWVLDVKTERKNPSPTEQKHTSPQEKIPVKLKIMRGQIDNLWAILPSFEMGRFSSLKREVIQEIKETPDDQFIIVKGSQQITDNRKERNAALTALSSVSAPLGWCVRWSTPAGGFLLVRTTQWNKIKGGK